jgi:hypothetical protein
MAILGEHKQELNTALNIKPANNRHFVIILSPYRLSVAVAGTASR